MGRKEAHTLLPVSAVVKESPNFRLNPERLRMHSTIRSRLFPGSLDYYDCLSPAEQVWFENSMDQVERMKSLRDKGFPIPQGFKETNLGHVNDSLNIAVDYARQSPILAKHIDFEKVQIYTLIHDIGEMADKVGDVQPTGRTRHDNARKRLEPIAARKAIITQISDPEFRMRVLADYNEYTKERGSEDSINFEIEMARFIDQVQGTTRAAPIAFDKWRVQSKEKEVEIMNHLLTTTWRMITPAMNLMEWLPTQEARSEMKVLLRGEIGYLEKYAPPQVARNLQPYVA